MLDNRAANAIFGRIGRVAAEVVLQLLRSKCIPIFTARHVCIARLCRDKMSVCLSDTRRYSV